MVGIRSAMAIGARFNVVRSKSYYSINATSKLVSSPLSSSSKRTISSAFRSASIMIVVGSQQPLHSAIASARLKSNLALDSSCWSCLSQGQASTRLKRKYIGCTKLNIMSSCTTCVSQLFRLCSASVTRNKMMYFASFVGGLITFLNLRLASKLL